MQTAQSIAVSFASRSAGAREAHPAEFRLALACSRGILGDRDRDAIHRIAAEVRDWEWFVRIVERNQIQPLVARNLSECAPPQCPPKLLATLRKRVLGFTSHSLSHSAELVRISEAAAAVGIEVVALKGVALAMLAYGNLALRSPGDIDVVVSPDEVFATERILLSLDYVRIEPKAELTPRRLRYYLKYFKHFAYYHKEKCLPLELHWRLYHNTPLTEFHHKPLDTMPIELGPGRVSTLGRDELFLYLCVHGALHGWPILKWIADIGAMLAAMDSASAARIVALAETQDLIGELNSGLILAEELLGISIPECGRALERGPIVEHIVAMAHRLLTAESYCLALDHLPRMGMFFYDLGLRSSWRYRRHDLVRALVLPDDWEVVDLPDALFPFYAAVRPFTWMTRKVRTFSRRRAQH